ncbi:uncharacterized protein A1O9_01131 [Exophiala aquamarina CBS 119918]|uniref:Uncharacterized protein n=1 Tax=Exophiala aquamarina CBS 119918 TaxID=1182545 RepID=A0A072Q5E7_9EURO|nr:uncharacterized protein A1O9_01131 [Exophiala aquamarina CBS 119918]KEF63155.1 hypothetical protein A1O9_01131 [Exophiala aquamarina CBS 119918]
MAGLTPLPPTVTHSTTRLTHREAHTFLSSFLSRAEIDAAYRPDSTLTGRGPQALSAGSSPNLTLHHLKRILLGIEGKRVGKQVLEQEQEGEGTFEEGDFGPRRGTKRARGYAGDDGEGGHSRRSQPYTNGEGGFDIEVDTRYEDGPAMVAHQHLNSSSPQLQRADDGDQDDWQEKETYDLAQSSEGLELTYQDRHPGADLEQPGDSAEEEDLVAVEDERTRDRVDPRSSGQQPAVNKEERKRLKKLKAQAEKSKREEQRKDKGKGKEKATKF